VTGSLPRFREAFVGYHWVFAGVVAIGYAAAEYRGPGAPHLLAAVDESVRSNLYLSLAGTTGVLLGFGLASVAVFTGLGSGRGMDFVRGTPGFGYTRTVFMGAIWGFAFGSMTMTGMIVADSAKEPKIWLEALAVGILALVLLRTWALLWLLNKLLDQTLKDAEVRYTRKADRQKAA